MGDLKQLRLVGLELRSLVLRLPQVSLPLFLRLALEFLLAHGLSILTIGN